MIVERGNLKYGYSAKGWDEVYQKEYGDLGLLRVKLLIEDAAVCQATRILYQLILERRRAGKSVNVLDIGCGVGHQLMSVAHLCDNALGFDISPEVVRHNNSMKSPAKFIQGDALSHPDTGRKYDVVMMCGVLYAIDEKRETHLRILNEAMGEMTDDGHFLFYHRAYLNIFTYCDKTVRKLLNRLRGVKMNDYYMCWFDDRYIKDLCSEIGLETVMISKDDFAYPMTSTFFRYLLAKPRYWNFRKYKEYNTFEKEYESFRRLNLLGRIVYIISRYLVPVLSARTSLILLRKREA